MSVNTSVLADNYRQYDDWIELYNPGEFDFDLSGCFLSDNPDNFRKWRFPEGTILATEGHLILWADEERSQGPLHLNFKLSSAGETLVLTDADHRGNATLDVFSFPALTENISAGRFNTKRVLRLGRPTPGESDWSDTDEDGLPDAWEAAFGLLVTDADSDHDKDDDGLTNLEEFQRNSDPLDPDSPPRVEQFGRNSFRWTVGPTLAERWLIEMSSDAVTWTIHARPTGPGEFRGLDFQYVPGMRLYRLRSLE